MNLNFFWISLTISLGGFFIKSINAGVTCEIILIENFGHLAMIDASIRHQRISRGVYSIHGTITIKEDIGNECTVETVVYRSPMGNIQFHKLPIGSALGKLRMDDFMNTVYHNFGMKDFENCTNLPQFDVFTSPFKAGEYYANNCTIADEAIPGFMQPGSYKLEILFTIAEQVFGLRAIFKLSPNYSYRIST